MYLSQDQNYFKEEAVNFENHSFPEKITEMYDRLTSSLSTLFTQISFIPAKSYHEDGTITICDDDILVILKIDTQIGRILLSNTGMCFETDMLTHTFINHLIEVMNLNKNEVNIFQHDNKIEFKIIMPQKICSISNGEVHYEH